MIVDNELIGSTVRYDDANGRTLYHGIIRAVYQETILLFLIEETSGRFRSVPADLGSCINVTRRRVK